MEGLCDILTNRFAVNFFAARLRAAYSSAKA